jgi:MurNAc alpha-1-phosphate uridylyltransferase
MLLAAGRGERMGTLTATQPKPLLTIGDRALIEHHVVRLAASGIDEIVINLSYRGSEIRKRLGDGSRFGVSIAYSEEGEPPLETGGGIVHALPLLGGEPFLLVNSDIYTTSTFASGRGRARRRSCSRRIRRQRAATSGRRRRVRQRAPPLSTYAGVAVFDPRWFAALTPGRRPLKPVLDAAIARRELRGLKFSGLWLDVGTPERLEEARALAARS